MALRLRSQTRFAILPPSALAVPEVFRDVDACADRYRHLLSSMQRLRGSAYQADGAILRRDLTADGRHRLSIDQRSWHVLSLDANGGVVACLRYLDESHVSRFDGLDVRQAALARCPVNGTNFRRAVESELEDARCASLGFGEVGGWAVREDHRLTPEALGIVLATYALLELLGGCAGVATA